MATDREEIGNRHGLGEREVGRILDQFRQPSFGNMPAIAVLTRIAEARTHRQVQIGIDVRQFLLTVLHIAGNERNFRAEMHSHRVQDPVDRCAVQRLDRQPCGSGGHER